MISKTVARTKAASVRTTLDALHDAVEALAESPEKAAVETELQRLHAKLNGAAHRLAEFFDDDVETFSGGTDKPEEP
jgi:hypothetical protein